jgi:hypothetical protein
VWTSRGIRWRDVTLGEMCMIVYGWAVSRMDAKTRKKFDYDLSPTELVAIYDDSIPEELRGERPPSWWHG